jgi:hypothetical protein
MDNPSTAVVQFWWPTPVLTRTYVPSGADAAVPFGPAQGTAGFRDWLERASADLLAEICRPGETPPKLVMMIRDYDADAAGQMPRRAPGAVLAGVFCIDPGGLTFLDPRPGSEMIPGTSTPAEAVRHVRLGANRLILYPGWLAQGHSAPLGAAPPPRWLKLWFGPAAFSPKNPK